MKSQVKDKEINFLETDGYTKNVYTAEFKNRASFRNGALHIVDKYDLNAVYIIYMNETNTESYIIKCPVVNSSKSHYDIQIKYRDNIIISDVEPDSLSSTEIRNRIKNSEDILDLLDGDVYEYIICNNLYE